MSNEMKGGLMKGGLMRDGMMREGMMKTNMMKDTMMKEGVTDLPLRSAIISQGRALYGYKYPTGHTFDIMFQQTLAAPPFRFSAHLIVYTEPNSFCTYTVVCQSDPVSPWTEGNESRPPANAMETLLTRLLGDSVLVTAGRLTEREGELVTV